MENIPENNDLIRGPRNEASCYRLYLGQDNVLYKSEEEKASEIRIKGDGYDKLEPKEPGYEYILKVAVGNAVIAKYVINDKAGLNYISGQCIFGDHKGAIPHLFKVKTQEA